MIDILLKYMSDFTLISEDEQRAITESLRIDEYKKGQYLLRQGRIVPLEKNQ